MALYLCSSSKLSNGILFHAGCNTSNSVKVSFGDLPKDQHIPITDSFGDLPKDQHIPITDSFGDLSKDQHIPVTDSCHDGSTSNGIPPSTETSSSNQQVCVSASDKLNSDVMDTLPTILSVQTLAKGTQEAVDNIDHLQHSKAIFLDANGDVVHVTVDNYVDLSGQLYTDGKLDPQTLGGKDHLNNHVLVSSQTQLLNTTSVSVQTSGEYHTDQLTQCDSTSNVELENGCSSSADAQVREF